MDVVSLAQIRQIVTEAAQSMREEMAVLGTDLRSEINDTKRHMAADCCEDARSDAGEGQSEMAGMVEDRR